MKKLKQKLNKLKQLIVQNGIEILFLSGLFFIVLATFLLNIIAGLYVTGITFITLSIILLRPSKKGR